MEVGADAFLLKPFSEELLIETVERLLAAQKAKLQEPAND
jgi:FixJ family two-component response regulator